MEVLTHPQNTQLHFQNACSSECYPPSVSSEISRTNTPSIEIHLHSQDETVSSSQSISMSHSENNPHSFYPSPEGQTGLARLLPAHATEGLEFIDHVASSGRMDWKAVELQFRPSASTFTVHGIGEELHQGIIGSSSSSNNNHPSFSSRIRIALDKYGRNSDGRITEEEIKQAILFSASTNKISISRGEAGDYARLIAEELDRGDDGGLQAMVALPVESSPLPVSKNNPNPPMASSTSVLIRAYWRRVWVVSLWLMACASLFAWKFIQYQHRSAFQVMGYCLCTAKGAAETLKLNMALVLLPVCRNTITWLRKSRRISSIVPFNDNINFHKLVAGGIVVGVILHGGTHLACDFPRIAGADRLVFRNSIGDDFQRRQPSYVEILATTEGATGIAMVVLMAIAFVLATRPLRRQPRSLPRPIRRLAGFNAFWYSHHLFVVVYVLLIVHSMFLFLTQEVTEKTTWMYIAIPILLYASERVIRTIRAGVYDVKVLEAALYPGKVLSLKLQKPSGFQYRSGMYIFIKCPQISTFEWHPFSLTSAPDDDYLSVHIRTLGDWSYKIYSIFQEALVSCSCDLPTICIDGPYGAASQDHINYDIVLLIGLGIGATPFVSILRDIAHGIQRLSEESVMDKAASNARAPRKAYFYWVTKEQGSFDWFRDIMREVSVANRKKAVIEMHNYLTSVFHEGDKRSILITAIQALHLAKHGIDIISRVPVPTQFARPNWTRVFSGLARRHGGKRVGVFYCGPEGLAKELESLCYKMTRTTSTRFVFHKEHY